MAKSFLRGVQIVLSYDQHVLQRGRKFPGEASLPCITLVTRLSMDVKLGTFEASLAS